MVPLFYLNLCLPSIHLRCLAVFIACFFVLPLWCMTCGHFDGISFLKVIQMVVNAPTLGEMLNVVVVHFRV